LLTKLTIPGTRSGGDSPKHLILLLFQDGPPLAVQGLDKEAHSSRWIGAV
jgi:hypothetical protein